MEAEILQQGLMLMLAGMGTVFVFLTALVVAMTLMSNIILRFQRPAAATEVSEEEVAAITVAISEHRKRQK